MTDKKSLQPLPTWHEAASPSQNGASAVEGRAEGSAFLGLFFRRGRSFSAEVRRGLLTPQQRAPLGAPLQGFHRKWPRSWGPLPSPDKQGLSQLF